MRIIVAERGVDGYTAGTKKRVLSPENVVELVSDLLEEEQEWIAVALVDVQLQLVTLEIISLGTADKSMVHPRDIFRQAIRHGRVSNVVLIHNHPSGNPTPSSDDFQLTHTLVAAGELLQIPILDHLIVAKSLSGKTVFYSFAEQGTLSPKESNDDNK